MRKPKFNEAKYNKALDDLAKQVAAMVLEDYDDLGFDRVADRDALIEDYTADTIHDLESSITEYATAVYK